jgi:hypothetical protein
VFDLNAYTSGGNTVFDSWLQKFDAIAEAAMQ